MLISKLLGLKPLFKKKNGQDVVDLTKRTFNRNAVDTSDIQYFSVDEDFSMRPDLIAKAAYQNTNLWDAILKFNGISNPFSIDFRQTIVIPNQNSLEKGFINSPDIKDHSVKKSISQILNPVTKQDKRRLEMLNTKPLPNNIIDSTDRNVKVRDGKIIFGEDVTKVNKEKCSGSVSRAKLKEKLLQNQIFTD